MKRSNSQSKTSDNSHQTKNIQIKSRDRINNKGIAKLENQSEMVQRSKKHSKRVISIGRQSDGNIISSADDSHSKIDSQVIQVEGLEDAFTLDKRKIPLEHSSQFSSVNLMHKNQPLNRRVARERFQVRPEEEKVGNNINKEENWGERIEVIEHPEVSALNLSNYGKQETNPQEYMDQSLTSGHILERKEVDSPLLSEMSDTMHPIFRGRRKLGDSTDAYFDYEQSFMLDKLDETLLQDKHFTIPDRPPPLDTLEAREKVKEIADFIRIDPEEKIALYTDHFACLQCRKCVLLFKTKISLLCQRIIKHPLFEFLTILVILTNSIILAVQDPTAKEDPKWAEIAEYVFLALYTLEFLLKVMGLGLILEKNSYLRDGWNVLDFIIIVSGFMYLFADSGVNLAIVRSLRVLRPLRTISGVEGLRLIVSALIGAIPLLANTLMILIFFFLVFAIAGLQLWTGAMKVRCVDTETGREEEELLPPAFGRNQLCGARSCPGSHPFECAPWYTNPNYGVTNFDDIFSALLVVFQCITLEGWSAIQIMLQQAFNFFVFMFFIPMVFIGAFFLLNLTLAVIKFTFTTKFQDQEKRKSYKMRVLALAAKKEDLSGALQLKERIEKQALATALATIGIQFKRKFEALGNKKDELEDANAYEQYRTEMVQSISTPPESPTIKDSFLHSSSMHLMKVQSGILVMKQHKSPPIDYSNNMEKIYDSSASHTEQKDTIPEQKSHSINQKKKMSQEVSSHSGSKFNTYIYKEAEDPAPQPPTIEGKEEAGTVRSKQTIKRASSTFNPKYLHSDTNKTEKPLKYNKEKYSKKLGKLQNEILMENINIYSGEEEHGVNLAFKGMSGLSSPVLQNLPVNNLISSPTQLSASKLNNDLSEFTQEYFKGIELNVQDRMCNSVRAAPADLSRAPLSFLKDRELLTGSVPLSYAQPIANHALKYTNTESSMDMEWSIERSLEHGEIIWKRVDLEGEIGTSKQKDEKVLDISHLLSETSRSTEYNMGKETPQPPSDTKREEMRDMELEESIPSEGDPGQYRGREEPLGRPISKIPLFKQRRDEQKLSLSFSKSKSIQSVEISKCNKHPKCKSIIGKRPLSPPLPPSNTNFVVAKRRFQSIPAGVLPGGILPSPPSPVKDNNTTPRGGNSKRRGTVVDQFVGSGGAVAAGRGSPVKGEGGKYLYGGEDNSLHKVQILHNKQMLMSSRLDVLLGPPPRVLKHDYYNYPAKNINQQPRSYSTILYHPYQVKIKYITSTIIPQVAEVDKIEELKKNDPLAYKDNSLSWSYFEEEDPNKRIKEVEEEEEYNNNNNNNLTNPQPPITPPVYHHQEEIEGDSTTVKKEKGKESALPMDDNKLGKDKEVEKKDLKRMSKMDIAKLKRQSLRIIELHKIEAHLRFLDPSSPVLKREDSIPETLRELVINNGKFPAELEKKLTLGRGISRPLGEIVKEEGDSELEESRNSSVNSKSSGKSNSNSKSSPSYTSESATPNPSSIMSSLTSKSNLGDDDIYNEPVDNYNHKDIEIPSGYKHLQSIKRLKQVNSAHLKRSHSKKHRLSLQGADIHFLSSSDDESMPPTPPNDSQVNAAILSNPDHELLPQEENSLCESQGNDELQNQENRRWGDPRDDQMEFAFLDKLKDLSSLRFMRKTHAEWNGQDVIPAIDIDRAAFMCERLNHIYFFPFGIYGFLLRSKHFLKWVVVSLYFEYFMTLCVLANTVILALDRYPISSSEEETLNILNLIFGAIFVIELILKLYALGVKRYFSDSINYLDCSVVIMSLLEILFFGSGKGSLTAFRSVRVFRTVRAVRIIRTMRVIRVARLFRALEKMQLIIDVIGRSIGSFVYIALLLFLILFIYCLLGMQIFGGYLNFPPQGVPRANFDTFHSAFISVFQVLTLENWQILLYDSMRIYNAYWAIIPVLFYITLIFIGNYVLLNLFLAVLLESFLTVEEEDLDEQDEKTIKKVDLDQEIRLPLSEKEKKRKVQKSFFLRRNSRIMIQEAIYDDDMQISTFGRGMSLDIAEHYEGVYCHYSLYIFHYQNALRMGCISLIKSKFFDIVILVVICLSSIKLIFDTYIINKSGYEKEKEVSFYLDIVFTITFSIECIIKATALGFVFDEGSYLRESWNQLDFGIVVTSILDLIFLNNKARLYQFKILRQLRTLRLMRFISHNSALQKVVRALLTSIGGFISVAFILFMIWFVFGIVGVSLFAGKLQYCDYDKYNMETKEMCEESGGNWKTYNCNFDNVIEATKTLFIVGSMEGWPIIMYNAADITDTEKGPKLNNSYYYSYFFIVFILIGSFFFLNLFVGVIFKKFEDEQRNTSIQDLRLTDEQKQWVDMQRSIVKALPYYETLNIPKNKARRQLHTIVTSTAFEIAIMACILLNMVQMACLYDDASKDYLKALEIINLVFTCIFILECVMKIIAFGKAYWYSNWNIFDFVVVFLSLIDLAMLLTSTDLGGEDGSTFLRIGPQLARVIRVIRVSRFLRLLNKFRGIEALLSTLEYSFIAVLNILGLLFLIFCMYAILGSFMFGAIAKGEVMDDYTNFQNFGYAMLLLVRICTGEDWHTIMYDCEPSTNCSDPELNSTCGSSWSGVYFYSFMWVCNFVLLNLFVLIIITLFEKNYMSDDNLMYSFKSNMDIFKRNWGKFARADGGMKIHEDQLMEFFLELPNQLGMSHSNLVELRREILFMDLRKDDAGYIGFNELLFATLKQYYRQFLPLTRRLLYYEELHRMKIAKMAGRRNKSRTFQKQTKKIFANSRNVNPFLTAIYMRRTFHAWKLYAILHKRKRRYYEAKGIFNYKSEEDEPLEIIHSDKEKSSEGSSPRSPTTTSPFKQAPLRNYKSLYSKKSLNDKRKNNRLLQKAGSTVLRSEDLTDRNLTAGRRKNSPFTDLERHRVDALPGSSPVWYQSRKKEFSGNRKSPESSSIKSNFNRIHSLHVKHKG